MKTLFDSDVRYAKAVVSGVMWKLEGINSFYRYPGGKWTPRLGGWSDDDEMVFNAWIASGLIVEVLSEDAF